MNTKWLLKLETAEDIDGFKKQLLGNSAIFIRLREILEEMEGDILRSEILDDFTGSWAVKQAHRNGQKAVIKKVKDLIDFSKPEE